MESGANVGGRSSGRRWRPSLNTLFLLLSTVVFIAVFSAYMMIDARIQNAQVEDELVSEARMFAREMSSVWRFMDLQQDTINYTNDGDFEFKGLHCSVVGKSIGRIFSQGSDYEIRYTMLEPRNIDDLPDEFETEALVAFDQDEALTESYQIEESEKGLVFRYAQVLKADETCLECHGEPVGELDVTGFEKEGWVVGDVGGAISISIPMKERQEALRADMLRDAVLMLALLLVVGSTIYFATTRFVFRPVNKVKDGFARMEEGDFNVQLPENETTSEMNELVGRFNRMAEEVDSLYGNLEEEVRDRTQELRRVNSELEELNAALHDEVQNKTDFLSMVSHELRTPLTSITTLADICSEEADLPDQQRAAWNEVRRSSSVLLTMINNMLDIARSDAGRTSIHEDVIELSDVAMGIESMFASMAEHHGIAFFVEVEEGVPLVKGDLEKTVRMIENFVSNALKFTPEGGTVTVSVRGDEDGGAVMSVSDTGIGIAPEDQERAFARFVQLEHGETRRFGGSGLGLSLVKEYAEMQGFGIELASELGRGSTFSIIIPVERTIGGADHE